MIRGFMIKDLIEKRCATFDELIDVDRQFFLEHPTAKRYIRPHFVGEFGIHNASAVEVLVTQIEVGTRVRSPIYATKNKRRSPKGRARDFRDFRAKR